MAQPVLIVNRLFTASLVALGADNADISAVKGIEIVVSFQVDEEKGPHTGAYKCQWRDVTDASGWSDIAATGEIQYGSNTSLVNNGSASRLCTATGGSGSTWTNGRQIEGTSTSESFTLNDEYYTELQFALSLVGATVGHQYDFQLYNVTGGTAIGIGAAAVTVLSSPATVALGSPANLTSVADSTPVLYFTGSDPESDAIDYQVQIDTQADFMSIATGYSFDLKYLDICISKYSTPTDNVYVNIRSAIDGTSLGQSANVAASTIGTWGTWLPVRFTFATPVTIAADTKYYWTISRTGPSDYYTWYGIGRWFPGQTAIDPYHYDTSWSVDGSTWEFRFVGYDASLVAKANYYGTTLDSYTAMGYAYMGVGSSFYGPIVYTPVLDEDTINNATDFYVSGDTAPYATDTEVAFTVPTGSELATAIHYWRVRGKDTGSGTWGTWSSTWTVGINTSTTLTTQAVSNVSYNTLTANGTITLKGSSTITRRGFCYMTGTSGDPTTANSVNYEDGNFSPEAYSLGLTGLASGTSYRIRAYAVDSGGTHYGNTVQTATNNETPTIVLDSPANAGSVYSTLPTLYFTGTDPENENVEYEIDVTGTESVGGSPVYDAVSSQKLTSSATYLEWNHVLGSGSNRIVVIQVAMRAVTASSVTFNGVSCTFIRRDKPGGDVDSELWYISEANLPAAGTYAIRVNGSVSQQWVAGAISFTNVSSIGANNGTSGSGTSGSVAVTTAVDDVVVSAIALQSANGALAATSTNTERWDQLGPVGRGGGGTKVATTTSTTPVWTFNSDTWAISVVVLSGGSTYHVNKDSSTGVTGFSGTGDPHPWASGVQVGYTIQADNTMIAGNTYTWKARVKDPTGSGIWSSWTSTRTFSVSTSLLLSLANSSHAQTAENVELVQHRVLVVQGATSTQTTENIVLTAYFQADLVTNSSVLGHTVENVILIQHNNLVVQDAAHTHGVENVVLYVVLESPATVSLDFPINDENAGSSTPAFLFTGTDPNNDELEYQIQIDTASDFSSVHTESTIDYMTYGNPIYGISARIYGNYQKRGQCFEVTADNTNFTKCKFYLSNSGDATGYITACLYTMDGTYGTTGKPNTLLATSTTQYPCISFTGGWHEFEFAPYVLNSGYYVITIEHSNTGGNYEYDFIQVHYGTLSDGTDHSGNSAWYHVTNYPPWAAVWQIDVQFYAISATLTPLLSKNSETDSGFTGTGNPHPWPSGNQVTYTSSSLGAGGTYYWRVRAKDIGGIGTWGEWSATESFYFTSIPVLSTESLTDVSYTTATGNGTITAGGGATITRRGFCYMTGTSGDPTTANSVSYDDGSFGTGAYTKGLTGLSSATNYRVRAYAVNSVGTGYGTTVQLATSNYPPTVVLNSPNEAEYLSTGFPGLVFTGTDTESGEIEYEVHITSSNYTMDSPVLDSTSSASLSGVSDYLEWDHTIGGMADRVVIIGVASRVTDSDSVTFNGVSCTLVRRTKPGSDVLSELWSIGEADIPVEGTYKIRITTLDLQRWGAGAVSYYGVTSLGNNNGASGSSTAGSVTLVTSANQTIVDCIGLQSSNASLASDGSQVERWDKATTVNRGGGSTETATGSSTVMSWTHASDVWAVTAVALTGGSDLIIDKLSTADAGFSGTGDPHPWPSGNQVTYTVQSPLGTGTYTWKVRGKNISGVWGSWSSSRTFNIVSLVVQNSQHSQTAENVTLVQHNVLGVNDATTLQTATTVSVSVVGSEQNIVRMIITNM